MRLILSLFFAGVVSLVPALTAAGQQQACDPAEARTIVVQNETVAWPRDLAPGEALPIRAVANDRDVRGGTLRVATAAASVPTLGQVSVSTDGQTIFFVPAAIDYPVGGGSIAYTVSSSAGGSAAGQVLFTAGPVEPEPDFSFTCQAGLCYFTANPGDPVDIRSYDWTFAQMPSCNKSEWRGRVTQCAFPAPTSGNTSSMSVTLSINYLSGRRRTKTRTVNWTVDRPKLEWSWYTQGSGARFGLAVTATLSCPTCITCGATPDAPIDRLTWLWGDEDPANPVEQQVYTEPCSGGSFAYPPTVSHTYRRPGVYIAKAIIRRGATGQPFYYPAPSVSTEPAGLRVEVRNTPPHIEIAANVIPSRPDEVRIIATITDDSTLNPPADEAARNALAPTLVEWDYGDGTSETASGPFTLETSGPLILERRHVYEKAGRYAVTMRATDILGETATYTSADVAVDYERPEGSFTVRCTGLTCHFDGSPSISATFTPEKYWWYFNGVATTTTTPTTSYTFPASGTYKASLTVSSAARGYSDGFSRKVMVTSETAPRLSYFAPAVPCRMYDTRTLGPKLKSEQVVDIALPTAAPCRVPADAKALHLNVVAFDPTASGNLTIWKGGAEPIATALNFTPDSSPRANNVTVAVQNGAFKLTPTIFLAVAGGLAETHVIVDLLGYYSDVATAADCGSPNAWCGPLLFTPVTQCRALDTRTAPPRLELGVARFFGMRGVCGVPATGVRAVALNTTVFAPAGNGNILVTDSYTGSPSGCSTCADQVSTLNMRAGRTQTNGLIARIGTEPAAGRDLAAWARVSPTDLIADVTGIFRPAASAAGSYAFHPVTPCRLVDTRDAEYGHEQLTHATPRRVQAGGQCGVPADAKAVVVNAIVFRPPVPGYLRLYPAGTEAPVSSVLNFREGDILGNTTIVELDRGALPAFTAEVTLLGNDAVATTDAIVDVYGYYR